MPRVLLIDDEPVFTATLARFLESEGYEVAVGADGDEGLQLFATHRPEAVLLDLRLPDTDGFDVCRKIRASSDVPVIILSARGDEMDKVLGLELGADDYATKDMSLRELLARIRAVTRRVGGDGSRTMRTVGGFTIDLRAREVRDPEMSSVELTQLEFDLLAYFVQNPGKALPREQIFNDVWHQERLGSSRTIDAHVVALRSKLPGVRIASLRGVGYRLDEQPTDRQSND